ncbi:Optic atrophy 3 protein (OPA3) [Nesidiocoris tenuis]|uniref:Optic atrophy 3 protein (OPA3) n=1 Tax=Nesidiocoris tenuis TaxID=355587 RepID=A0ABN7AKK9_9HEMI|nr:Optic atrophy 3 protein (OPA3) [Nesidiocoris tenuis]
MVAGVFPAAKLGVLLMKQLSKPIANYVKENAKKHPFFRKHVCMPPAQFYNWCEVKMKMWIMNLGKPVEIPKLNEAMAIELGANLLGETIIFSIAAFLLYLEYARQVRKETAKEAARAEEMLNINTAIRELTLQSDRQDAQLRELLRAMADLESKVIHRPFAPRSPPKNPPDSPSPPPSLIPLPQNPAKETSGNERGTPRVEPLVPVRSTLMTAHEASTDRYKGGTILDALDYITFRIPNGYSR